MGPDGGESGFFLGLRLRCGDARGTNGRIGESVIGVIQGYMTIGSLGTAGTMYHCISSFAKTQDRTLV